MAVWGLDVQQVRQLSSQLQQKSGDIESILSQLTTALNNTQWTGPDAESFRSEWSGTHTASLKRVVQALSEASQKAAANATAQESVSNNA
ncbi:WXG100 family type VII secretion target [Demequina iriomotensis]|uniref:WXG100 family type VII secretion target n=1 Tax=Demequina iriomotensis TaxID=1536641 RepID=UPI000784835F|nr:WXG100 family type VII secretion target [Demequina iriomotensis]